MKETSFKLLYRQNIKKKKRPTRFKPVTKWILHSLRHLDYKDYQHALTYCDDNYHDRAKLDLLVEGYILYYRIR